LKFLRKKFEPIFKRILELFTQKIVTMLSKIWVWVGIRDPEKTYSGSRIQGSKRHRIPDPDPQHCYILLLYLLTNTYYQCFGTGSGFY
jgi:hypothetical protein